jgi:hypothetical protein
MYLSALLVCSVSIVLAVLVPRLFVRPTCCSHFPVVVAWAIGTVGVVVSITLLLLARGPREEPGASGLDWAGLG